MSFTKRLEIDKKEYKMKIGFDIDDTISSTCEYFNKHILNKKFNIDVSSLIKDGIYYMQLTKYLKKEDIKAVFELFEKSFDKIPAKENAVKVINSLKEKGHKIYIITARNNKHLKDAYRSTAKQLKKYGIKYDKLICDKEKAKVCEEYGIDLFFDDSHFNIEEVSNTKTTCYLFTSYYNKDLYLPYDRVSSWDEVNEVVSKMSKKFKINLWDSNILFIQLLLFYLLPMFFLKFNHMGTILLNMLLAFFLSIIFGYKSNLKNKAFYPMIVSLLFIPSVFIFYNKFVLIHSAWYLFITAIGVGIGSITKSLFEENTN